MQDSMINLNKYQTSRTLELQNYESIYFSYFSSFDRDVLIILLKCSIDTHEKEEEEEEEKDHAWDDGKNKKNSGQKYE